MSMTTPLWLEKLKTRWKLKSVGQVFIVLVVFACTGFTVLLLKKPVLALLHVEKGNTLASVLYYVFILPIYNVILLAYGFVFGQFRFFWDFEKRSFNRVFRKTKK